MNDIDGVSYCEVCGYFDGAHGCVDGICRAPVVPEPSEAAPDDDDECGVGSPVVTVKPIKAAPDEATEPRALAQKLWTKLCEDGGDQLDYLTLEFCAIACFAAGRKAAFGEAENAVAAVQCASKADIEVVNDCLRAVRASRAKETTK